MVPPQSRIVGQIGQQLWHPSVPNSGRMESASGVPNSLGTGPPELRATGKDWTCFFFTVEKRVLTIRTVGISSVWTNKPASTEVSFDCNVYRLELRTTVLRKRWDYQVYYHTWTWNLLTGILPPPTRISLDILTRFHLGIKKKFLSPQSTVSHLWGQIDSRSIVQYYCIIILSNILLQSQKPASASGSQNFVLLPWRVQFAEEPILFAVGMGYVWLESGT
jgi:hypothetical protein